MKFTHHFVGFVLIFGSLIQPGFTQSTLTTRIPSTTTTTLGTTSKPVSKFIVPNSPRRSKLTMTITIDPWERPKDCDEVRQIGYSKSATYKIYPFSGNLTNKGVYVFCNMDTAPGYGWTVIQRRAVSGLQRESFDRNYSSYSNGFGSTCGDHFIGLDVINAITESGDYQLRITIPGAYRGGSRSPIWQTYLVSYRKFRIGNAASGYQLIVSDYNGNAADIFSGLNGTKFLTKDIYPKNCSWNSGTGPWWYSVINGTKCTSRSNTFNGITIANNVLPYTQLSDPNQWCQDFTSCFYYTQQSEISIQNPFSRYNTSLTIVREMQAEFKRMPRDCSEIQLSGNITSGVYKIYPTSSLEEPVYVYCDLVLMEGGWTTLLSRGNTEFQREQFSLTWFDYERGFGQSCGDFWFGLSSASALLSVTNQEIYIALTDWNNSVATASYKIFKIGTKAEQYKLTISNYSGTAGDALGSHSGGRFTTLDVDNDVWDEGNCAQEYGGGWWYMDCFQANLNGEYMRQNQSSAFEGQGLIWSTWRGFNHSIKSVQILIRNVQFSYLKTVIGML